jgi:transposase
MGTPRSLSPEDAQKLSAEDARKAALQYSQLYTASTVIIQKLEKRLIELTAKLGDQDQEVLFTKEMLANLRQKMYGRSSERREDGDGPLFAGTGDEYETVERKKRTRFGRKEQTALSVVEVVHELPENEAKKRGLKKWDGQFEISELITVVPTRFVLEQHKRQKYLNSSKSAASETGEPAIVTAPGPLKLQEGGRYSIEFGVEVGLAKYLYHMPLERQVRQMKDYGLDIESQTLFAQTDMIAWLLKPHVIAGIARQIQATRVNEADETSWMNLGQEGKNKFYLWGARNKKAVCFNVYDSRSKQAAKDFLGQLKGVLVTDGYGVYHSLAGKDLITANDWYHVRRKFVEAEKQFPAESKFFVDCIRALSSIEEQVKGKPPDEVKKARQSFSKPIVEEVGIKIENLANVLPQSSLGKAVHYTRKLWKGLSVFLDDPEVPFGTNEMEGAIRGAAVGRKNHYGSKNLKTADVAAVWYSVIETCKANGVDPREYVTAALKAILTKQPVTMPWDWPQKDTAQASQ